MACLVGFFGLCCSAYDWFCRVLWLLGVSGLLFKPSGLETRVWRWGFKAGPGPAVSHMEPEIPFQGLVKSCWEFGWSFFWGGGGCMAEGGVGLCESRGGLRQSTWAAPAVRLAAASAPPITLARGQHPQIFKELQIKLPWIIPEMFLWKAGSLSIRSFIFLPRSPASRWFSYSPRLSRGNALETDVYRASVTWGSPATAYSTGIARPASSSTHLGTSQSTQSQRTTHRNSKVASKARKGRSHSSCGKKQKEVEKPWSRCQLSASPSRLMASDQLDLLGTHSK